MILSHGGWKYHVLRSVIGIFHLKFINRKLKWPTLCELGTSILARRHISIGVVVHKYSLFGLYCRYCWYICWCKRRDGGLLKWESWEKITPQYYIKRQKVISLQYVSFMIHQTKFLLYFHLNSKVPLSILIRIYHNWIWDCAII